MTLDNEIYKWYAVYTRVNREKKLLKCLLDEKIECYLPLRKVLKTWSDRKKWVEEPLFKSYIFVKVSNKEFFNVLNNNGVVCYVCFGGKAQSIPEDQIMNIKNFLMQCDRDIILTYEKIQKGITVEVAYGSLKGIKGEVTDIFGQSRLLIRIDSLSCSIYVNISKEEVKPLKEQPTAKKLKYESNQKIRNVQDLRH
jgi:transcription antitermination factor NusG